MNRDKWLDLFFAVVIVCCVVSLYLVGEKLDELSIYSR